ncbi:MAG: hypothetical protein AAFX06_30465 [Planctomycetota bacterium]
MTNPFEPPRTIAPPRKKHSDSFTLARPGLKPEHYIPFRLRAADTFTAFAQAPMLIVAVGSVGWAQQRLLDVGFDTNTMPSLGRWIGIALYIAVATVALVKGVTLLLRFTFQFCGILTSEEARSYPLPVTGVLAHWPETWQKPMEQ